MALSGKLEEYKDAVAMLTRMPSEHKRGAVLGLVYIVVGMVAAVFVFTWSDAISDLISLPSTAVSVVLVVAIVVLVVAGVKKFTRELNRGRYEMSNRL